MANRDKKLEDLYGKLSELHRTKFPSMRFGQFYSKFFEWLATTKQIDAYFPNDDDMERYIEEYCARMF